MFFRFLKSLLRDYLTLTTRERRGTVTLLILVLLLAGFRYYDRYWRNPELPDFDAFEIRILRDSLQPEAAKKTYDAKATDAHDTVFVFNPNTLDSAGFRRLGLKPWQIASLMKYRMKGGRFRMKNDFARLYGLPEAHFLRLQPFIDLPDTVVYESHTPRTDEVKRPVVVHRMELNGASADSLEQLPLIGPSRASRIIRYRDALGGFVSTQQLQEVYGMDSTVWHAIEDRIRVDSTHVRMLDLNNDSLRHPYLNYAAVKAIRAYRRQHGDFHDPQELSKITLLNEEILRKIAPYLAPQP